jgi:Mce-associated membrane protein
MTDIPPDRLESPAPARPRRALWTGFAVLVVLAALAGAAWTGLQVRQERTADDDRAQALSVARQAAVAFTSYDAEHIDEDLDRVRQMSTGDFRDQFTKALGALTGAIRKAHGVSKGEVSQAGLIRSSDSTAVVIAAVDATIANKQTQQPSLRRYRLEITLTRVDDAWLISDISPVA